MQRNVVRSYTSFMERHLRSDCNEIVSCLVDSLLDGSKIATNPCHLNKRCNDSDAHLGVKTNTRVSTKPTDPVSTPDPGLFISK